MKNIYILLIFTISQIAIAQEPHAPVSLSAEDYSHAEQSLSYHANNKVYYNRISVAWSDNKLIYSTNARDATKYYLVNLKSKNKSPLFASKVFAKKLFELTGIERDPGSLSLRSLKVGKRQSYIYGWHPTSSLGFKK